MHVEQPFTLQKVLVLFSRADSLAWRERVPTKEPSMTTLR
jgi:hypothetical protein